VIYVGIANHEDFYVIVYERDGQHMVAGNFAPFNWCITKAKNRSPIEEVRKIMKDRGWKEACQPILVSPGMASVYLSRPPKRGDQLDSLCTFADNILNCGIKIGKKKKNNNKKKKNNARKKK